MRKVELAEGIRSAVLGFGCAPVLGAVDKTKAKRALDFALENGINHFDLARSYGYGEAENFVGKLLKGKRQQAVIATKFGIKTNWKASLLRPAKPIIRFAMDKIKKAKPADLLGNAPASVASGKLHYRIPLTGKEMCKSLEESLKALETDYVDYFFIHEPHDRIATIDELFYTAGELKKQGKIRAWGLAYMRAKEPEHSAYLNRFDVLQFDNSPGAAGYENVVKGRGEMHNIIFSPLKGGSKEISAIDKLKLLFSDFPQSVILCSMFNEEHIRNNIAVANLLDDERPKI